jgi:hypothetical protein
VVVVARVGSVVVGMVVVVVVGLMGEHLLSLLCAVSRRVDDWHSLGRNSD